MESLSFSQDQSPDLSIIPPSQLPASADYLLDERQQSFPTWSVKEIDDATSVTVPLPASRGMVLDVLPHQSPMPNAYRLLEQVGRGGMGEVWESEQVSLARRVAVKRLRDRTAEGRLERLTREVEFRQEAFVAASLEHPNIVPIHDLGIDEAGSPLMAMKLVEGKPWNKLIEEEFPKLPEEEFLSKHIPILMAMTQAVAFAHSRGIVHRDLKPSQVLVGEFGEVLLADWGLAIEWKKPEDLSKRFATTKRWIPTPTTASNPAGTPALMAPEQTLPHAKGIGPWTDIYLIGSTLYYLLTGVFPHSGKTAEEAMTRAAVGEVIPPTLRTPSLRIPEDLEDICMRALARDPANRTQTATEVWQALDDHMRGTARRSKSRELAESARIELTKPGLDFSDYNAILSTLEESCRMWPDNPQCGPLKSVALGGSARQAVSRGDLSLARLQAESVTDQQIQSHVMREVEQAERAARRRHLFLRSSAAIVVSLLAIIAVISVSFSRRMAQKNLDLENRTREAERNLSIAGRQGEGAFEVINFVLRDLKTAMDGELTVDRGITIPVANEISHAIAGQVANPVVGFFEGEDDATWPDDLRLERARQMKTTAARLKSLGRYQDAFRLLKPALATVRAIKGSNDAETADFLNDLGDLELILANYPASLQSQEEALRIRLATLGASDRRIAESYFAVANTHYTMGRFKEAKENTEIALELAEQYAGPEDELTGRIMMLLGILHMEFAEHEDAARCYDRALAILQEALGPQHQTTLEVKKHQATLMLNSSRWDEAEAMLEDLLEVQTLALGAEHPETVSIMTQLGGLLTEIEKLERAQELLDKAFHANEKNFGPDHPQTAIILNLLAKVHTVKGEESESLALHKRALEIDEKFYGPDHNSTAVSLSNYAISLSLLGKYDEAKEYAERGLQTSVRVMGPDDMEVAYRLMVLCNVETAMEDWAAARSHCDRAMAISEQKGGDQWLDAHLLSSHGVLLYNEGKIDDAIESLSSSLASLEDLKGGTNPDVDRALRTLSVAVMDKGDFEQALPILQRIEKARFKMLGPLHPLSVFSSVEVAMALGKNGQQQAALEKFQKTMEQADEHLGPEHQMAVFARVYLFLYRMDLAANAPNEEASRQHAEEGLKVIEGREELVESDAGLLASYATILLYAGRAVEAEPHLQALKEAEFDNPEFWEEVTRLTGKEWVEPSVKAPEEANQPVPTEN